MSIEDPLKKRNLSDCGLSRSMSSFRIFLFLTAFAFISLFTFSESTSLSNVRVDNSETAISELGFPNISDNSENRSTDVIINNIANIAVTDIASIAVAVIKSSEVPNGIIVESK